MKRLLHFLTISVMHWSQAMLSIWSFNHAHNSHTGVSTTITPETDPKWVPKKLSSDHSLILVINDVMRNNDTIFPCGEAGVLPSGALPPGVLTPLDINFASSSNIISQNVIPAGRLCFAPWEGGGVYFFTLVGEQPKWKKNLAILGLFLALTSF